jgi:hypothetical protein
VARLAVDEIAWSPAAEGGLQDLPGDRNGGCAAEPGADEHYRDRDAWVLRGAKKTTNHASASLGFVDFGPLGGAGIAGYLQSGTAAAVPVSERTTSTNY